MDYLNEVKKECVQVESHDYKYDQGLDQASEMELTPPAEAFQTRSRPVLLKQGKIKMR